MNLANYPPESCQKLGLTPRFPHLILYHDDLPGERIYRSYLACGCFHQYKDTQGWSLADFCKCTLHDGIEQCFLTESGKELAISDKVISIRKKIQKYRAKIADLEGQERHWFGKHYWFKAERDVSPTRK